MSRVGKTQIKIPAGVTVEFSASAAGGMVTVTGSGNKLTQEVKSPITVEVSGGAVTLNRPDDLAATKSLHGLYNRLVANMVKGVSAGFTKYLFLNGVGYKAAMKGEGLTLNLGMSHSIDVKAEPGVKLKILTPQEVQNLGFGKEAAAAIIQVTGASRQLVGAVAGKIRGLRPVEPYHLYGIRYSDEHVIRKESKSGAKKK
jgi:large subunit ribosomal protein L6